MPAVALFVEVSLATAVPAISLFIKVALSAAVPAFKLICCVYHKTKITLHNCRSGIIFFANKRE